MTDERGFTLAELMISVAVLGLMMAGVFALQQQGQFAYLFVSGRVEVQQNARIALDLMVREIRSAQSITDCATATQISFTDENGTAVTYALGGTSAPFVLLRSVPGVASPNDQLIGGVRSLTITCYTSDAYTTTTTAASVRSVKISVQTMTEGPASSGSVGAQSATVEARVRVRNL